MIFSRAIMMLSLVIVNLNQFLRNSLAFKTGILIDYKRVKDYLNEKLSHIKPQTK
jgi:hypothetical protein